VAIAVGIFYVVSIVSVVICFVIGRSKGHAAMGLLLGLLFSMLGVLLVIFVVPDDRANQLACPSCSAQLLPTDSVCSHCGREVSRSSRA
jgi:hypothetical protein